MRMISFYRTKGLTVLLVYFYEFVSSGTDAAWIHSTGSTTSSPSVTYRTMMDRPSLLLMHETRIGTMTKKSIIHPSSTISNQCNDHHVVSSSDIEHLTSSSNDNNNNNRRNLIRSVTTLLGASVMIQSQSPRIANAVGPIKIALTPLQYSAVICPPDRPIPGEKAMIGMRGLCVTVRAKLDTTSPKALEKVGVYGFVNDGESGDSVLANNPDGGTDAGQFAMIESITPQDSIITFDFIAAVPRDKDLSIYDNGIGPLDFASLRLISYPGGQQFGAISPCEMNEFSEECEAWENVNGPYKKAEFMVKSNPRTKGS